MTIYAIADVHGHLDKLRRAHDLVAADRAREGTDAAPVVHLGDLNDRGPDTHGVIQLLIDGLAAQASWIVLLGNHDRMFRSFLVRGATDDTGLPEDEHWLHPALGGVETLASYGVVARNRPVADIRAEAAAAVPQSHVDFLSERPLWHEAGELLFVHAGIRPGVRLDQQTEHDLVWIREGFLEHDRPFPWLVVHGHTALQAPEHFGNRVDLDGGAAFGRPLHAAVFEGRDCWLLDEGGRTPLVPG